MFYTFLFQIILHLSIIRALRYPAVKQTLLGIFFSFYRDKYT